MPTTVDINVPKTMQSLEREISQLKRENDVLKAANLSMHKTIEGLRNQEYYTESSAQATLIELHKLLPSYEYHGVVNWVKRIAKENEERRKKLGEIWRVIGGDDE
jgi:hypothetical protein